MKRIGYKNNGMEVTADGNLYIYNAIGQLVYSQAIQNEDHKSSLDLTGLSEGTYFLQLMDGGKQTSQTLVITH